MKISYTLLLEKGEEEKVSSPLSPWLTMGTGTATGIEPVPTGFSPLLYR